MKDTADIVLIEYVHTAQIDPKVRPMILKAMNEFAYRKVKEQRDIMAKHLNMRNVPNPVLE